MDKQDYLKTPVTHIDPAAFDAVPILDAMGQTAFSARSLGRAARVYETMIADRDCTVILCLAGSLISAGLKKTIHRLVAHDMVDAVVATGANLVDQDFFEALGFDHYAGSPDADDNELRELGIDRIYDTYIDEDQLRVCDATVAQIADALEPRPYSSREFLREMGRWLVAQNKDRDSIVRAAYEKGVPLFAPAFSDSSAGFGLVHHQWHHPESHVSIDSAKDFLELTRVKIASKQTGLVMVGGGVPKNFAQDVVVSADFLGYEAPMHKYAIQLTVADVRDGALSSSTLKEASSWGKVDQGAEQMVYAEATLSLPLLASYVYHKGAWKQRAERRLADLLDQPVTAKA